MKGDTISRIKIRLTASCRDSMSAVGRSLLCRFFARDGTLVKIAYNHYIVRRNKRYFVKKIRIFSVNKKNNYLCISV